jgi:hypothetical protein
MSLFVDLLRAERTQTRRIERRILERCGVGGVLFLRRRIALSCAESQGCPHDHHSTTFSLSEREGYCDSQT